MKNMISNIKTKLKTGFTYASAFVLSTSTVFADLPKMQEPTNKGNGGIMDLIKGYGGDAVILGGLLVAAYAFMKVAGALISEFGEVQAGRKKWGDLGMLALVGAILLVVIIWLVTEASKIL